MQVDKYRRSVFDPWRGKVTGYSIAAGTVAVAGALTWWLRIYFPFPPTLLFMLAVLFSALKCGLRPGLAAAFLSVPVISFFFMEPIYSFRTQSVSDTIQLVVFVVAALLVNGLNQAKREAEAAHQRLLQQRLDAAVKEVKMLEGLLAICSWCKRIRKEQAWIPMEIYISQNSETEFTHGICPECRQQAEAQLIGARRE